MSVIYKPVLASYTPSIYKPEEKVFKEEQKAERPKPVKEDKVTFVAKSEVVAPKPKVVVVEPIQKEEVCTVKTKDYQLKEGDYLYKIARKNNMSFKDLLELNEDLVKRKNKDLVYPDEVINLNYYTKYVT